MRLCNTIGMATARSACYLPAEASLSSPLPFAADVEPPLGAHLVTPRHGYAHHGIYVGDGRFLHAPSRGKDVRVDSLLSGYWSGRFVQGRRVAMATATES